MLDTAKLPDRLLDASPMQWLPASDLNLLPHLVNAHAHHDTNPWGWDGGRVLAELWVRGVGRVGMVAFDSASYVDGVAAIAQAARVPIPCYVEALTLTPCDGEEWNDLPGRMYLQAGPFTSSADAAPLTNALVRLARQRATYQIDRWNESLPLGFRYQPDLDALSVRGLTEANLCRDLVDSVNRLSPDPSAVWRAIPGLTADPSDPNFARAFRTATMVSDAAVARVPRTSEFYLPAQRFVELSGGRAHYMYVGKHTGVEANREALLDRMREIGLHSVCVIPQRNMLSPADTEDLNRLLGLLEGRRVGVLLGTELNAHGQWWSVDLRADPFAKHGAWLEACWEAAAAASIA